MVINANSQKQYLNGKINHGQNNWNDAKFYTPNACYVQHIKIFGKKWQLRISFLFHDESFGLFSLNAIYQLCQSSYSDWLHDSKQSLHEFRNYDEHTKSEQQHQL
jgi:hypothetical protein